MASYARRSKWIIPVLVAAVAASTSWAEITPNGDVSPADPSTWDTATEAYIGNTANGSVLVNNGGTLLSDSAYLGFSGSATGAVTIDGPGSTWTIGGGISVGASGTGTLNITNGGQVNSSGYPDIYLGSDAGGNGNGERRRPRLDVDHYSALDVGGRGTGSLNITNGGQVSSDHCDLGSDAGASGMVTVDGLGSKWTVNWNLYVGNSGAGTLNIANGGQVTVAGLTYVAYNSTGTGSINFGATGGTLTTQSLYAATAQITGTGTINTRGLVSDGSLVFDATHGLNQTPTSINASQHVTIHLNMTDSSYTAGDLGAGYQGAGTLTIRDGVASHVSQRLSGL